MLVRKLRLQRGWSQEHLAELVGVSVRTIQRIERGFSPSLETSKALASVFEVDVSTFISEESTVNKHENLSESATATVSEDEKEAMLYVKGIKEFYDHLFMYLIFAFVFAFAMGDDNFIRLGLLGWGVGVLVHGLVAYEKIHFPGLNLCWEKRAVERRLGRKL